MYSKYIDIIHKNNVFWKAIKTAIWVSMNIFYHFSKNYEK